MIQFTRQVVKRWLDTLLHVNDTPERTAITVHHLLDQLLPRHSSSTEESLHQLIDGVLKSRGALGFWGAFAYFWSPRSK